jgi:hypothetical protein
MTDKKSIEPKTYTVVTKRSRRGMTSYDHVKMTMAEIKDQYRYWNGEGHIIRADYRLGLSIHIRELRPQKK